MAIIAELPLKYYPDPTQGRPVFFGSVFFGLVDADPEVEANRRDITITQEDGSRVLIPPSAQPLNTGAGGVIEYNGSPVLVTIDGNYSVKVLNQGGTQVYYVPDANAGASEAEIASDFLPGEQFIPDMTIQVGAGTIYNTLDQRVVQLPIQNTPVIVAPLGNPRIDRVHVDHLTGTIGVTAGDEAAVPVPPQYPSKVFPVGQIALQPTTVTITDNLITDERAIMAIPYYDQWVLGPTPIYISATSFSLAGDQTVDFHVGRRLKTTNSGGTIYSTIIDSVYTSLTTITVANDSGALDSGLSEMFYGILSAENTSMPDSIYMDNLQGEAVPSAATTDIWSGYGRTKHITGTTDITSLGTAKVAGDHRWVTFDDTLTLTHSANLSLPGGVDIITQAGDVARVYADTTTQHDVQYFRKDGTAVLNALVPLASQIANVSATIDFTTKIDSTYDKYIVEIIDCTASNNTVDLLAKISKDGGSTWVGGTAHRGVTQRMLDTGTVGYVSTIAAANFQLATDLGNNAAYSLSGYFEFYAPANTSLHKGFLGTFVHTNSGGQTYEDRFVGKHLDITAYDGVQFYLSAGTISTGTFNLYGVKKA